MNKISFIKAYRRARKARSAAPAATPPRGNMEAALLPFAVLR